MAGSGLKALLDAAHFLELQEQQSKLSPQSLVPASNGQPLLVHVPAAGAATAAAALNISDNSNVITSATIRSQSVSTRHTALTNHHSHQVSSSAPAATATFQHASGLTITSSNSSQLITATTNNLNQNHHHSDFELTNANMVGATGSTSGGINRDLTIIDAATRHSIGHCSEGRMSANPLPRSSGSVSSGTSGNNSNQMMVDDVPPHMSYVQTSGSSIHSTSGSSGNHYIHVLPSAQQGNAGSQVAHVPPTIAGSGRRRTVSSNSNGAGTREVHNKLEKNRRAHLKECYALLRGQLQLKDDDRKKTSNLAILHEALRIVRELQKQERELEARAEKLSKEKIMLQKRAVALKRELGPKFEQLFGMFGDFDFGIIASEKDNINDNVSLSSGRGSMLYSSSSSLSSGGSNGSNTMSSPIGAGLPTALPTAISTVISKTNSNNTINATNTAAVAATTSNIKNSNTSNASPISPNMLQHFKTSASANNSPADSPTTTLNGIVTVNNSVPLSLTRGSPTPSTPSPSPSSSSGVSSSCSLISSSPPINGVITGRTVPVNIPNGLRFQTSGGATIGTIGNSSSSAVATIIASSPTGANVAGAPACHAGVANGANNNNATVLQALRGCRLV